MANPNHDARGRFSSGGGGGGGKKHAATKAKIAALHQRQRELLSKGNLSDSERQHLQELNRQSAALKTSMLKRK